MPTRLFYLLESWMKEKREQRAILAGLCPDNAQLPTVEVEMAELARLLYTAGGTKVAQLIQIKDTPDPRTYLGSGKIRELAELVEREEVELVVFNDELSPSQIRNLEDELSVDVIDRTMLILDIFALHAKSGEGKLQVELAQLKYSAPRLIGKGEALSRQEGRIGTRGPGESKLETDRRYLKRRESALIEQIKELSRTRSVMRSARDKSGIPRLSLVGYTNAGKSTLLNALTDAGVLAEDKLFATLDTTTRRLTLTDGREVLLTDTVGFIRRLPHHLVKAFRSTLEEVLYADLLLLVVDVSDPEAAAELAVTKQVLSELGAGDIPTLTVYNKCDRAASFDEEKDNKTPGRVFVSAKEKRGLDALLSAACEILDANKKEVELFFPYASAGSFSSLSKDCTLLGEAAYEEDGIRVKVRLDSRNLSKYSEFILGQKEK